MYERMSNHSFGKRTNISRIGTMGVEVDDLVERLKGRCIEQS
jgi:hypothetical protein